MNGTVPPGTAVARRSASSAGPGWSGRRHASQRVGERGVVAERPLPGLGVEQEVERVQGGHVQLQPNLQHEARDRLGQHEAGDQVARRVLLPMQAGGRRIDLQPIARRRAPRVRPRPQPHPLRPEPHRPVVAVFRPVQDAGRRHRRQARKRAGSTAGRMAPAAPGSRPAITSATSRPAAGEVWMP